MKIEIHAVHPTSKCFTISFTAEEVETYTHHAVAACSKYVKVPGFRQGKAPADRVKQAAGPRIREERNRSLLQVAHEHIAQRLQADNIGFQATITKIEDQFRQLPLEGGETFFKFTIEFIPEFELATYKGIPITKRTITVSPEDAEQELARLGKQRASYEPSTEASQIGDYVKVSYTGSLGGTPLVEILPKNPLVSGQSGAWYEAGAANNFIYPFTGHSAGDTFSFNYTFPEGFTAPELVGKTVTYMCEVHEVRRPKPPSRETVIESLIHELKLKDSEAVLKKLEAMLLAQQEQQEYSRQTETILQHLHDHHTVLVPPTYVKSVAQDLIVMYIQQLMRQGIATKAIEQQKEALYQEAIKKAEIESKLRLILEKIAKIEGLKISEQDMWQALYQESLTSGQTLDALTQSLKKAPAKVEQLRKQALRNKTLAFLMGCATVVPE